ncbi:hypothetical protein [Streptomyces microflavus]|uniref:hypothetical protein n=1 Tax=Streptomyces microflavus TaxID=1919 RepID=UPI00341CAE95|nr:hypothetical protein OH770_00010 [Streptomyces microflavus]WTF73612.1 hypothetical protein OH770_35360 [Streptomyces microflavus]
MTGPVEGAVAVIGSRRGATGREGAAVGERGLQAARERAGPAADDLVAASGAALAV